MCKCLPRNLAFKKMWYCVLPVGCWWSQWAVMAAHHCYFWWWWWSDALWVTLIRWWLHSMLSYLQCVVEISLQSHINDVLPGWCAKGWGQVIWSCKLSLHVHGENYILFELVFGFILIVDIHLSLAASLFIFFSSGNRVVKYFKLCWWCCCLQQRWKEKFFVNVGTDCGLTIAGFYYVCFSRSDGSVHGFYYDPNSRFVWLYSCP